MQSQDQIDFRKLRIKILDEVDDLSSFSCTENDIMGLDEFIHKEALQYQKEKLGVTYLFLLGKEIVGFVTLAMGEIEIDKSRILLPFSVPFRDFPSLLIGRLGVHNNYRKREIGKNICLWVLGFAKETSNEIGCRFIHVLTQGDIIDFYEKSGFEAVNKKKKKVMMYKQIPR